jgi:cytoskeleton protein RodZ
LKREREQRKITLDDISIATKIGTRFLVAIEEDHFDQLPGGIFNKGFVRAYARHLGLDETRAIADFVAATEPTPPESPPQDAPELAAMAVRVPETASRKADDGGIPWGVFAMVLLVMAFGFAVWGFHSREKSVRPSAAVPPPLGANAFPVAAQKAAPDPAAQPVPPAGPVAHGAEGATPAAAPAGSAANAGGFLVLIKARENAWVTITADGRQVVQDTLAPPAEKAVEARSQVVIRTGNAGALDISFNGKKLASPGRYHEVKTLTFDPNGLRP